MSTESPPRRAAGAYDRDSPMGAVTSALHRAAGAGELSPADLDWSLAKLAGRGRREADGEAVERQAEIRRAATRVFAQRGYHHATIEEVAGELGLTKAGVYHYFGSKQKILEAICNQAIDASGAVIKQALGEPGTPTERLRRAAEGYASLVLLDDSLSVFIRFFDDLSPPVRAQIRKRRKRIARLLRRTLEQGVATGEFDTPDLDIAVHSFFGIVNWSYTWYARDGRLSSDEVRQLLVSQVMAGVSDRGRRSA